MEPTAPAVTCPSCRHANAAGSSFCSRCGTALAAAGAAGASPSGWDLATASMHVPALPPSAAGMLAKEDYAGWWMRLGAWIVDGLILLVFAVVGGILAYFASPDSFEVFSSFDEYDSTAPDTFDTVDPTTTIGLLVLGFYVFTFVWEWLWVRSSHMAKPGQIALGFRVVKVDGIERLTSARALGRAAGKLMYNIPQAGGLAALVSAFTIGLSERRQGLHDLMAGTACVRTSSLTARGLIGDGTGGSIGVPPPPPPPSAARSTYAPPAPPPPTPPNSGPFV